MPQAAATSWWTEVEHLREPLERRRREAEHRRAGGGVAEATDRSAGPRILPRTAPASPEEPRRDSVPAGSSAGVEEDPPRTGRFRRREHEEAMAQAARQPARRTVRIRGQAIPAVAAPRLVEVERRRPPRRASPGKVKRSPDRVALWAFVLGVLLIAVAILTAHAG
jgi:hypothetical protein